VRTRWVLCLTSGLLFAIATGSYCRHVGVATCAWRHNLSGARQCPLTSDMSSLCSNLKLIFCFFSLQPTTCNILSRLEFWNCQQFLKVFINWSDGRIQLTHSGKRREKGRKREWMMAINKFMWGKDNGNALSSFSSLSSGPITLAV